MIEVLSGRSKDCVFDASVSCILNGNAHYLKRNRAQDSSCLAFIKGDLL